MKTFIIVYTARTGSTGIFLHLNQHPHLAVAGDIFLRRVPNEVYYNIEVLRLKNEHLDINDYMKFFARTISNKKTKMVGFKCVCHWVIDHPLQMEDLAGWIHRNRPHIIHVERHSKGKQIISQRLARARKKSHLLRGQKTRQVPIAIDPGHLKKKIDQTIALNQKIVEKFGTSYPYIKIMYEDFYSDTYKVTSRLCDFLGVDRMEDLPLPTDKISPVDLSTVITNYDDVKGLL